MTQIAQIKILTGFSYLRHPCHLRLTALTTLASTLPMTLERPFVALLFMLACLVGAIQAQPLTVREIMAEPSIAGQRVEG